MEILPDNIRAKLPSYLDASTIRSISRASRLWLQSCLLAIPGVDLDMWKILGNGKFDCPSAVLRDTLAAKLDHLLQTRVAGLRTSHILFATTECFIKPGTVHPEMNLKCKFSFLASATHSMFVVVACQCNAQECEDACALEGLIRIGIGINVMTALEAARVEFIRVDNGLVLQLQPDHPLTEDDDDVL